MGDRTGPSAITELTLNILASVAHTERILTIVYVTAKSPVTLHLRSDELFVYTLPLS